MRDRFGLKVALLAVGVAVVSFVVALQVLDDGEPDPPPSASALDTTTLPPTTPTTEATTSTTAASIGELTTPAWVAIVASEGSRAPAEEAAAEVAALGYPAGVLESDDYGSLNPGLWVGYAGPYGTAAQAEAVVARLEGDGVKGAYVRCIGTKKECDSDASDRDGGDD